MATDLSKANPDSQGSKFKVVARTQAEEDAYNYVEHRIVEKPTGLVGSIAHMVKGALGAGVLSAHVTFKTGGFLVGTFVCMFIASYMGFCLFKLVKAAQVLYRRCRVSTMSYPDVGEAAFACNSNPKIARFAKVFRHIIDAMICIELFGSCATYQIIVAKSLKQLVEGVQETSVEGYHAMCIDTLVMIYNGIFVGYPNLRVYLACMIIPMILICLIRHLKWLAPLSIVANFVILFCIIVSIYYAFHNNPTLSGMAPYTSFLNFFECCGMIAFSMSCVGLVLPVENNMKNPKQFGIAITIGYICIFAGVYSIALFGYAAFLNESESPITVNFPLNTLGKILKGCIVIMIFVTHALNFWVPFTTVFFYIEKRLDPRKVLKWEFFYRALFVLIISLIAITFPNITRLMGFIGAFCLMNLGLIFPNVIHLLVIWERPGFGKYNWRLLFAIVMILIAVFLGVCGTGVSLVGLVRVALGQE